MFVSISNCSKPEKRIYQVSLLCALMLPAAAPCTYAQTATAQAETGYSSSLDYTALAPGQPSTVVLTASALPQPALHAFESSSALPQSGSDAKPAKQSADPDFHKYTVEFGFGANMPGSGDSKTYQSTGFGMSVGFGRNFSSRFGAQAEYNLNFFGVPSSIVNTGTSEFSSADVIVQSISVNPYVNLNPHSKVGFYVIGGGGYYWKDTGLLVPSGQEYCGGTDGCIPTETCGFCTTGGAFGFNGGGGVNFGLGSSGRMKLFVDGRYVWVNKTTGSNDASINYPPENLSLNYIPVLVGIRW
jgi:hypothetical protein